MIDDKEDLKMKSLHFIFFLSVIFVSLVVFRLFYSNPIEFNGESILKWHLGKTIVETGEWGLLLPEDLHEAHHELRWSVIMPQVLLATFFPTGYASYFITPILFYSLFTIFCVAMYGRTVESLLYGTLLGLVISFEPMGQVMASQLNTGAFGLLYVIVAFWCLLKYLEIGGRGRVAICALFCFFAYGAHITYLMFWVVPAAYFVINRKDYKTAILFLFLLGFLYVFENWTLGLISNGDVDGGRVGRIWEAKQSGATRFRGGDLFEVSHFFSRWWLVPKYDFLIMVSFLIGSLTLLIPRIRKAMPAGVWLSFYGALIYGLAVSFPIIGLNPIRLALDLHNRYLALFFPLASIFVIWLVSFLVRNCGWLPNRLVPMFLILIFSSMFFWGTTTVTCTEEVQDINDQDTLSRKIETTYCGVFRFSQEQNIYPKPSGFIFRANKYYADFNEDYVSGEVALFGGSRIGVFRAFVRVQYPNASFIETANGWYSIDGEDKSRCVMELGQTKTPDQNYRDCFSKKMDDGIFN
jgi:hypothetical protein